MRGIKIWKRNRRTVLIFFKWPTRRSVHKSKLSERKALDARKHGCFFFFDQKYRVETRLLEKGNKRTSLSGAEEKFGHTSKLSLSPSVYIRVVNAVSINLIVHVTVYDHDGYLRHTGKSGHACECKLALYYCIITSS
jgi:hypothetical protein